MSAEPPAHDRLARRLGTGDAVVIGVGSMLGAGVFAAFAPAAQAAGSALLVGLAIAAAVAYANATSTAQLAAQHPSAGGAYLYGREQLGPWWGFVAGWGFVIGKTASCAAMALTFGAYVAPPGWERPVAVLAVVVLAAVNYRGITRTARLTRILVAVVLLALAVTVLALLVGGDPTWSDVAPGAAAAGGWYGILQSAGLLFFAFAGYARIATLGEEVRDPARTIPRAVVGALAIVVAVYAVVAVALLAVLGAAAAATSGAPLSDAVVLGGWDWAGPVVRLGAAAASLGALLALIAGVGRTSLAMARERDLPGWLAAVHPRHRVPHRAEVLLAAVVCLLVLSVDLRGALGFSSFGVLTYYFVANLGALRQAPPHRRWPRPLQVFGLLGCVVLVATLPPAALAAGIAVLVVGVGGRLCRLRVGAAPLGVVLIVVATGGVLGALARYGIGLALPVVDGVAWSTLLVNALGSLLLGGLIVVLEAGERSPLARPFLAVGVLGGFTTFSAVAGETLSLLQDDRSLLAMAYWLGTVVVALASTVVGILLARRVLR